MNLRNKLLTAFVLMVLCVSPLMVVDLQESDAADSYFKYTLTNGSGTTINVTAENAPLKDFDSDGYGPFNSFYAAFDSTNNNKMICHLNPNNLQQAITKTIVDGYESFFTAVDGTYSAMDSTLLGNANIMWCLPTIYWYVENGSLVLTNDPSKGEAFAHTINSKSTPYNYLAIGVYEAYKNSNLLMSKTGVNPTAGTSLANFRTYANAVTINTDGKGVNGDAGLWNYYQFQLYRLCAFAYTQDYNVQSKIGRGNGSSASSSSTGNWDENGPVAGTTVNSSKGVKLYIENAWGSLWDCVDDAWWSSDLYAGQNSTGITSDTSGKSKINIKSGISGYGASPDSVNADSWGMPTANGGSYKTGTCDYFNSSYSGYALIVGGHLRNGDEGGVSCLYYTAGSAGDFGSRLAFVFDADPATVTLDHSNLASKGGDVAGLKTELTIEDANTTYPDMGTTSDGFIHIGWYVDDVFYDKTSKVATTKSHTAYSVWKAPSITITFRVDGSIHSTLEVPKGSVGVVYTPVMVEGIFGGWYYDPGFTDKYDATRALDGDIDLYASGVPPLVFTSVPVAVATITPVGNNMVFFDATASDGRYSILWDFGDGNTSTDPIAYNTYTEPGRYDVTLTVTNLHNESVTETYTITVGYGDEVGGGGGTMSSVTSSSHCYAYSEVVWSSGVSSDLSEIAGGVA